MGKGIGLTLREAGLNVKLYHDIFEDPRLADDIWLRQVFKSGLVALSHNRDMRYDPKALEAVLEEGGRLFLIRGKSPAAGLARKVLKGLPSIRRILNNQDPPFIAVIRQAPTARDPDKVQVQIVMTRDQLETRLGRDGD